MPGGPEHAGEPEYSDHGVEEGENEGHDGRATDAWVGDVNARFWA